MSPNQNPAERFALLEALLDDALAAEPAARDALLARRCVDPELLREARELLAAVDASEHFLEHRDPVQPPPADAMIGTQLGPWRVTDMIGGAGHLIIGIRGDDDFSIS